MKSPPPTPPPHPHPRSLSYMKNIFTPKENSKVRQNDIIVKRTNTRFGAQSLRFLGPKTWNNLPSNIKSETSFPKFNEYIKTRLGPKCGCMVCINKLTENFLLFLCIYICHVFTYIYSYLYFLKIFVSDLIRFYARFILFHYCIYADLLLSEDK